MITYGKRQTNIFFEGNSLSNQGSDGGPVNGHYVTTIAYNTIIASKRGIAMHRNAISGQKQSQINSAFATRVAPYAKPGDWLFNWEGTNSLDLDGLSAAAAFAELVTLSGYCSSAGINLMIGTVIARDGAGDAADLMTRIDAYNVLVRNNAATYGYRVCDLAANAAFDSRADASSGNYGADKIHLVQAGQDIAAGIISTSFISVL